MKTKMSFRNFFEKYISPYLFVLPYLFFFAVFALTPVIMSLILSFLEWDYTSAAVWKGLDNFKMIFNFAPDNWNYGTSGKFWKSLSHTILLYQSNKILSNLYTENIVSRVISYNIN